MTHTQATLNPRTDSATITVPLNARRIAHAMALLWVNVSLETLRAAIAALDLKRDDRNSYLLSDIKEALEVINRSGWQTNTPEWKNLIGLDARVSGMLYRELLDAHPVASLRAALYQTYRSGPERAFAWNQNVDLHTALWRLELFSGASARDLEALRAKMLSTGFWQGISQKAAFPGFDPALFERVTPEWRWQLVYSAAQEVSSDWQRDCVPMCEWALAKLDAAPEKIPPNPRLALAEVLLHRGEAARCRAVLAGMDLAYADVLRAALLVQEGKWSEGRIAFEQAIKRRQVETGLRKHILPDSITWLYPLSLLAQPTPSALEVARKYVLSVASGRNPSPFFNWGQWLHAIDVRRGTCVLEPTVFAPDGEPHGACGIHDLWMLLLAAWLGSEALGAAYASPKSRERMTKFTTVLRRRLQGCGLIWLLAQADAAAAVLDNQDPGCIFFVPPASESWRRVLEALQALDAERAASAATIESTRLLWAVTLGEGGVLLGIEPLEQKRGTRGWSKPKAVPLSRLAGMKDLSGPDAKVARAIRQSNRPPKRWMIDRAAAVMALIGHPGVVMADAPEHLIDVTEGVPELEVVRVGDHYRLIITPTLDPDAAITHDAYEVEAFDYRLGLPNDSIALRAITIVRDSPQRLRVIRMTPAQRRAAQLVSGTFKIPSSAQEELKAAVRALASHFQVHSDQAAASREVEPETRLRAELSPVGEHLLLRLVVTPLGQQGPRLAPGNGRQRLIAPLAGETVGTRRDLDAERAHRDAVLDALPHLDLPDDMDTECEWLVTEPETALAMIETLPGLPAVSAVEWPKGKPVRIVTLDRKQLGVVVSAERDWFRIQGRAAVDESLVLDFDSLLAAGRARSRFVAMGEGVYVALTRKLKQQLADLAAVAESDAGGTKIPRMAAAWLDETLQGATVESDKGFKDAIERLRRAQDTAPELPKSLQAHLRPYQEDGYRWAMRLASAGLGGCLADDMGLGKTLQGLAVLLARGHLGPALVIAPTSVCGNWMAESVRFAPSLNVFNYGEGDRDTLVSKAGPMDVIVISYTLLLQASERFAARTWSTVIADEAQAIKNASAKRSLAVFELDTEFRLALSGTPVENRLSELWSIMRFANPGLLSTLSRFTERFAGPIERNRDRDAQQLLRRLIGPFVLRRTKAQVLQELPPRTELLITVAPEPVEAAFYEALRREAMAESDRLLATAPAGQAAFNILASLTRLRRAACDPRLVDAALGIAGAKVQAFADLALELAANGHKALVFSQFVDFLQLLRVPLDAAGIPYQYLDGSTPATERTRRVTAFQAGQGDLFLISLKAGGYGLNLTAADYVLITDPWWNPAAEDQAMGRAHRIGQSRPVTVYRIVTKGTVEERIVALHQDKRALADSVIAEGDATTLPSAEDLVALMRGD